MNGVPVFSRGNKDPAVAQRIHSAWFDIEVTTPDLKRRFRLSCEAMKRLALDLGPRPSYAICPKRGTRGTGLYGR
jgi:hypothetical protein